MGDFRGCSSLPIHIKLSLFWVDMIDGLAFFISSVGGAFFGGVFGDDFVEEGFFVGIAAPS